MLKQLLLEHLLLLHLLRRRLLHLHSLLRGHMLLRHLLQLLWRPLLLRQLLLIYHSRLLLNHLLLRRPRLRRLLMMSKSRMLLKWLRAFVLRRGGFEQPRKPALAFARATTTTLGLSLGGRRSRTVCHGCLLSLDHHGLLPLYHHWFLPLEHHGLLTLRHHWLLLQDLALLEVCSGLLLCHWLHWLERADTLLRALHSHRLLLLQYGLLHLLRLCGHLHLRLSTKALPRRELRYLW